MTGDDFKLQRFVDAQDRAGVYQQALAELRAGRKRGHWIWFVFPQIDGLGSSEAARFYAIMSPQEARAYLAHPLLGPRLIEACEAMLGLATRDAAEVLGELDALKLRSSVTLFAHVDGAPPMFRQILDEFFAGRLDGLTEEQLTAGTESASSCGRDRPDRPTEKSR